MIPKPVVIDIEASGFGRGSYPIEIGLAMADTSTRSVLIKPLPIWTHWDAQAETLHGLSRQQLIDEGYPPKVVARYLNRLLRGQTIYSDAWGYDQTWLATLFNRAELQPRFRIDTLMRIVSEPQKALWNEARQHLEAQLETPRHRAAIDAELIQQTFILAKQWADDVKQ